MPGLTPAMQGIIFYGFISSFCHYANLLSETGEVQVIRHCYGYNLFLYPTIAANKGEKYMLTVLSVKYSEF